VHGSSRRGDVAVDYESADGDVVANRGSHGGGRDDLSSAPDLLLASLIARAAFLRQESRGAHFRTDVPAASGSWRGRIHWRRTHAPRFEEVLPQ
jgi:aspartate oxidase